VKQFHEKIYKEGSASLKLAKNKFFVVNLKDIIIKK
jgi:hypothetical protein